MLLFSGMYEIFYGGTGNGCTVARPSIRASCNSDNHIDVVDDSSKLFGVNSGGVVCGELSQALVILHLSGPEIQH